MEAREFLKTYRRMCRSMNCANCPLGVEICDIDNVDTDMDKIIAVTEEWGKNHPIKTRQSELLKLFPETEIKDDIARLRSLNFIEATTLFLVEIVLNAAGNFGWKKLNKTLDNSFDMCYI